MLEVYYKDVDTAAGYAIGWDSEYNGKMFGVYPATLSKEDFMLLLLDIPVACRNGYELLVENIPCRAYVDVEWKGKPDPDHSTLQRLVIAIRHKVRETLSREPRIFVCCGTRPTSSDVDHVKHSYHIVCENIIFERNDDGQMKIFFTSSSLSGFTWMDGLEEKPMIDHRVYTKNRQFRLPHCTKKNSTFPLLRISGDPLEDVFTCEWGRDVKAVLPFFISNPQRGDGCIFIPTAQTPHLQLAKRTRRVAATAESSSTNKLFPVPLQVVQRLLVLAGDTVSTIGSVQYLQDEDQWQLQCNKRGQERKCLVSAGTTHFSNNVILFINRFDYAAGGGFRVKYQCMASECAGRVKPILGYISINTETYEWQIARRECSPVEDVFVGGADPEGNDDDIIMQEEHAAPPADVPQEASPFPSAAASAASDDSSNDVATSSTHIPCSAIIVELPIDEDDPDTNTYEMVKARFELQCFRMRKTFKYIKLELDEPDYIDILTHTDVLQYYCDMTYWGPDKKGNLEKLSFIHKWIHDPKKKNVKQVVVDPTGKVKDSYNIWRNYIASELPSILLSHGSSELDLMIEPIVFHIRVVITRGNQEHTEWIMDYMANIIQRPEQPTRVAISLYGPQGAGKGIIFEWFRIDVLGKHCTFQTSKPEQHLMSTFANGMVNKVLIQVDEIKSLHDFSDRLKDLITNLTVNYEKKGRDSIVLPSLANFIFTSNNANALTVSPDDRRFVLFHCSDKYKGDEAYFNTLGGHLKRKDVARAFYDHLMSRDLSKYPETFEYSRPITEYYREVQSNSIPVVSRFLSALVNSNYTDSQIQASELYSKYVHFHGAGNYKVLMTETAFGRDVKRFTGISKKRTNTGAVYTMVIGELKTCLEKMREYDTDTEFFYQP
jgi:hypothetical protein